MTTAVAGASVLVYVDVSATETPDYKAVACQTNAAINLSNTMIDMSCKNAADNEYAYGRGDATLTLDSLFVLEDDGLDALIKAADEKKPVICQAKKIGSTIVKQAEFLISGYTLTFPDNDRSTVSMTLQRTGSWEEIA